MSCYEDSLHLAEMVALTRRLLCVTQNLVKSGGGGGASKAMDKSELGVLSKGDFVQEGPNRFKYTFKNPFPEKPVLLFNAEDSTGTFVPTTLVEATKDYFIISDLFAVNPDAKVHYMAYTPKPAGGAANVEDSDGNFI